MASILIYQSISLHLAEHHIFIFKDDKLYNNTKKYIEDKGYSVLWEKRDVTPEQIEHGKNTINELMERLDNREDINIDKELSYFFKRGE